MDKVEEFLKHHGVKGMRWGVRRFQPYPKGSGGPKGIYKPKKSRTEKRREKVDKIHNKQNKNKTYSKNYDVLIKKGRSHSQAVNTASKHARMVRAMELEMKSEAASDLIANGKSLFKKRKKGR